MHNSKHTPAENAELREDLNVARSNWEEATEEVRKSDQVRGQLVAALRMAEAFMAGFEGSDLQDSIDAKLEHIRAALAAAGAA